MAPFFIPLAYALILLRANTGIPCVFWADLYGSFGPDPKPDRSSFRPPVSGGIILPRLLLARQFYAYGTQADYFDQPECIGFARFGHTSRSGGAGCAVVLNIGWTFATKRMCVGARHAGERWTDLLRWTWGSVVIDAQGYGVFPVGPRGVAVWVDEKAEGRDLVDEFTLSVCSPLDSSSKTPTGLMFANWLALVTRTYLALRRKIGGLRKRRRERLRPGG